jgi:hypothetical protein
MLIATEQDVAGNVLGAARMLPDVTGARSLPRVLTGAPSEWKMRNRVAALVSANPSICRDGHRVLAVGRPD